MADEGRIYAMLQALSQDVGGIKEVVGHLKESAAQRDLKLDDLKERVRQNEHSRRNEAQVASGRIERIEKSGARIEASVTEAKGEIAAVDGRVKKLELPIQIALARRARNQKIVIRLTAWGVAIAGGAWVLIDPIYKPVAEYFVRRWLGGSP